MERDTPFVRVNREAGFQVEEFPVYGCRVLAGIGDLPKQLAALSDRCLTVRLERKGKTDRVERVISRRLKAAAEPLRLRLHRLSAEHGEEVRRIYESAELVELLSAELSLDDRAVDGWLALVAIADLCDRRDQALSAARAIAGEGKPSESVRVELLRAIHRFYFPNGEPAAEWLSSSWICDELNSNADEPWCGWNRRSKEPGIKPRDIARTLKPFGIEPKQRRTEPGRGGSRERGYLLHDLKKPFSCYLPEIICDTVTHSLNPLFSDNSGVTDTHGGNGEPDLSVTPEIVDPQSSYVSCHGVTDKNPTEKESTKKPYSAPSLKRLPLVDILRRHGGNLLPRALEVAIRRQTGCSAELAQGAVELAIEAGMVVELDGRIRDPLQE